MVDSVVFESFILESVVGVFVFERDGDGGGENGGSNVRSAELPRTVSLCRRMFIPLSTRGSGDTRRICSLALQSFGDSVVVKLELATAAVDGFERDSLRHWVDGDRASRLR